MTDALDVQLQDGEHLVSDEEELVFRQATKHMFHGDLLSTAAFGPSSADKGMPSYSRSSKVTAQEARDWHSQHAKSASLGVWGLTVGEVIDSELKVIDDSQSPFASGQTKRAPGHCFIDFRDLSKRTERELRARLYFYAMRRGEIPTAEAVEDGQLFRYQP